jgi:transposase
VGGSFGMIPTGASVFVATQPVDFRKGASGLMALVQESGADPFSGALLRVSPRQHRRVCGP